MLNKGHSRWVFSARSKNGSCVLEVEASREILTIACNHNTSDIFGAQRYVLEGQAKIHEYLLGPGVKALWSIENDPEDLVNKFELENFALGEWQILSLHLYY